MRARVTLLVVACCLVAVTARTQTAAEMLSSCRPVAKADISGDYAAFTQNFETGQCWGAFSVIQQTARWGKADQDRLLGVCAPAKSRLSQFIAVFVHYAENHPERLHEDFVRIAYDSLREAFPCRTPRSKF